MNSGNVYLGFCWQCGQEEPTRIMRLPMYLERLRFVIVHRVIYGPWFFDGLELHFHKMYYFAQAQEARLANRLLWGKNAVGLRYI